MEHLAKAMLNQLGRIHEASGAFTRLSKKAWFMTLTKASPKAGLFTPILKFFRELLGLGLDPKTVQLDALARDEAVRWCVASEARKAELGEQIARLKARNRRLERRLEKLVKKIDKAISSENEARNWESTRDHF